LNKKNSYKKKQKFNRIVALVIIISMVLFAIITTGVALMG
jgi:hypothetical protein